MKEYRLLYQVKELEKSLIRFLSTDEESPKVFPTPTQMQIIEYILRHEAEEVFQKDLEKALNLRRATISGVLQTMEKYNLVERTISTNDARTKKVVLSAKTREMYEKTKNKIIHLEKVCSQNLSSSELENFISVIEKMKNNIKNYSNLE